MQRRQIHTKNLTIEKTIDLSTSLKMFDNIYENEFKLNNKLLLPLNNFNESSSYIVESVNFLFKPFFLQIYKFLFFFLIKN